MNGDTETLGLPTLEERRERRDLIPWYKVMNEMKTTDRDDLLIWDARVTRSQKKKLMTPNGLQKEIIEVKSIHEFKLNLLIRDMETIL